MTVSDIINELKKASVEIGIENVGVREVIFSCDFETLAVAIKNIKQNDNTNNRII